MSPRSTSLPASRPRRRSRSMRSPVVLDELRAGSSGLLERRVERRIVGDILAFDRVAFVVVERLIDRSRRVAAGGGALAGPGVIGIAVEVAITEVGTRPSTTPSLSPSGRRLRRQAEPLLALEARPAAYIAARIGRIGRAELRRAMALADRRGRSRRCASSCSRPCSFLSSFASHDASDSLRRARARDLHARAAVECRPSPTAAPVASGDGRNASVHRLRPRVTAGIAWGLLGVAAFSVTLPATRVAVASLDPVFVGPRARRRRGVAAPPSCSPRHARRGRRARSGPAWRSLRRVWSLAFRC